MYDWIRFNWEASIPERSKQDKDVEGGAHILTFLYKINDVIKTTGCDQG